MSAIEIKVYKLFKKRLSEEEAQIFIAYFETKAEEKIQQKKDILLTKNDKVDIMRVIYFTNIVQLLATIGSVIAIVRYMVVK